MKVTIIVDNSVPSRIRRPFLAEHGLSMLIEYEDKKLLFDTGQSDVVIHNLSLLGIHTSDLDGIILSHGHYDHAGGLRAVLTHAKKSLPVYSNNGIFAARFSCGQEGRTFVGIPYPKESLSQLGADFRTIEAPTQLSDTLWLSGPVPRYTKFEQGDTRLIRTDDNTEIIDTIPDDLSMFYKTERGLVVISGCAHAGIINIIRHGFAVTGCTKLYGIVGGTHLGGVDQQQRTATLAELQQLAPAFLASNHCTGLQIMGMLQSLFGERFISANVGVTINI